MATASEILGILDSCSDDYTFPMLDNGYVYLAATRLSLFRSPREWAMVIEVFGFSPRAGIPDLNVSTFARGLHEGKPHEAHFFYPIAEGRWQDEDDAEAVAGDADARVVVRGRAHELPPLSAYERHGIELEDPDQAHVFELARYLAAIARDDVLATPQERRVSLALEMQQLLVLDDWHHPDLVSNERPSQLESFQQLALVLETGDVSRYRPGSAGNTHWRNWPDGGSL